VYIDSLSLKDFRTFAVSEITFVHPDCRFSEPDLPKPMLPNINLLLGDNGLGKTTLLKAVALAALGPAVSDSGIYPYHLVRREPARAKRPQPMEATIAAAFTLHRQDQAQEGHGARSLVSVVRRGDLESLRWTAESGGLWEPIFSATSDAFFFVGYGATRRVERPTHVDMASRKSSAFARAQRVQSLFEEAYSLIPLNTWLPRFRHENPGRFKQVVGLINKLTGKGHYRFTGEMEAGECLFSRQGLKVPFPALSDGYQAFLGWVGDLLYHVCMTCPKGKKLVDNRGIVMVDEIDLHLHPDWQMSVLRTLANALPKLQFIVTSHSPLLVGSLEWMNIIAMQPGPQQSSQATRIRQPVHGLDADQVLLTEFFGLESTRAPGKQRALKDLTLRAREGDAQAAEQLLAHMSRGMEGE